MEDAN